MKSRRNEFFAKSVKNLGKSKLQQKREETEKVLRKRLIQLGKGFETATDTGNIKKLRRSGTLVEPSLGAALDQQDSFRKKPTQNIDNELFNEFKDEEDRHNKDMEADEDIPDIEEVFQKKKKKIALKMKNYHFQSIQDVFENREEKAIQEALQHGKQEVKKTKKEIDEERKKEKLEKKAKKKQQTGFKAYQQKMYLTKKKYHEDLEDIKDSDDNQDDALKKLEENYNKNHKSDIYVTGTLSIVFEKPKHESKMLNMNYYYNIHPETFLKKNTLLNISDKEGKTNESQMNNNNIHISGFGEDRMDSKESYDRPNISVGSIRGNSDREGRKPQSKSYYSKALNQSGMLSPRSKSQMAVPSPGLKKNNKTMNSLSPLKRGKTFASAKPIGGNLKSSGPAQSSKTAGPVVNIYSIPKPEVMSDRQILRRLNNNIKKSTIFQKVNFQNLPDHIRRTGDTEIDVKLKTKKKKKVKKESKKKEQLKEEKKALEDHEDISDTSEEDQGFNEDLYVDRSFDNFEEVAKAKDRARSKGIDRTEWSGQDIMTKFDPHKARIAIEALNEIRVWPKGFHGYVKRWRVLLKRIMRHSVVENLMTFLVFFNTIALAMDRYGIDDVTENVLTTLNLFFTIVFFIEMVLKITANGIVKYLNDPMNYMDGTIVLLSMVELIFLSGSGALSAFRSVRMLRTLRVLRVARLLRGLKSMINIINVIQRSLSSFMYLGMLVFLFIFIYALLGMQLYGGNFNFVSQPRYTFDSFQMAFVLTFDLLTVENWNNSLFNAMNSGVNYYITAIYFVSCIFIGNYMLLNLFLSILFDAFTSVEEEDHETPEKIAAAQKQRREELKQLEGEELIQGIDDLNEQLNTNQIDKKKKKKKKKSKKQAKKVQETNILDESVEIDMEALLEKQQQQVEQKAILFQGIECQISMYLFSQKNIIRIWTYKIVQSQKFENFILSLIVVSTIKLILDTYISNLPDDDIRSEMSARFDTIFTALFAGEAFLKVISYGFIQEPGSYLRESWSQLDFFIVVTSLIDASFQSVNIPIVKVFRLLRILRPLRFLSHNSSMKAIVVALMGSLGGILNVGIVVLCVFLMFAILGVNLFAGKLQYCSVDEYVNENELMCFQNRGEWLTYNQNCDNVIRAMMLMYVLANQEGWPDIMYQYTDITDVATGPKPAASFPNAWFFVVFLFIGNIFLINLFVGVLFMNFEAAQRDEKEALMLDQGEINWVDMMKMITNSKPDIIKIPKNRVSEYLYEFTKSETKFEMFIMAIIILNMLSMAIGFEGETETMQLGLDYCNYCFTGIFTLEAILKMIANGWAYFSPGWHKFDFFVVCSSYLDIVMSMLSATSLKFLKVGPQLLRVLRVLRVTRLFRLLGKAKGLQALIQTITFSLPSLMNVSALVVLVYFIFAVLGVFLFKNITEGIMLDPVYMNFTDFHHALIILIRMSTGEDWPTIMYDTMNNDPNCIPNVSCGISYSPVYFFTFIMIQSYIMLNLFVLVIIQQFELYYLSDTNSLSMFREDLTSFKKIWQKFSREHDGIRIKSTDLVQFFKDLGGNLAFGNANDNEIIRNIVKMNLESDEQGFIYFNDLLFKAMKRVYGKERTKKRVLIEIELKTLERLIEIKKSQSAKARNQERVKAVTVNPFLAVMYKNMSFKAWLKLYKQNLPRRQNEIEYQVERESSDEEEERIEVDGEIYEYVTEGDESCHSEPDQDSVERDSVEILDTKNQNMQRQRTNGFESVDPGTLGFVPVNNGGESSLNTSRHVSQLDMINKQSDAQSNNQGVLGQATPGFKIKLQRTQNLDQMDQQLIQTSQPRIATDRGPNANNDERSDFMIEEDQSDMNDQPRIQDDDREYRTLDVQLDQYISVIENQPLMRQQQDSQHEDLNNFNTQQHLRE